MVMKRSALGRGLDALITMDDLKTGGSSSISEIELSKIQPNPDQPRSVFEEETLEELAVSIRSLGVIQPITLKETGTDKYMIISGERRYRASLMAGLERIPGSDREYPARRPELDRNSPGLPEVDRQLWPDAGKVERACRQEAGDDCQLSPPLEAPSRDTGGAEG